MPPISCFYCGKKVGPFVRDHFVPASQGGPDAGWNRVDSCYWCDKSKASMHPRLWLDVCPAEGRQRVYQKLVQLDILDGGKPKAKSQAKKKGIPRDGRSTSDGPGSWYSKPTQEELAFHQKSIEQFIAQPMPPPPWSSLYTGPRMMGTARSLRSQAKKYLEIKTAECQSSPNKE